MVQYTATVSHNMCHCTPDCKYMQSDISVTRNGLEIFAHEHTDFTVFYTGDDVRNYLIKSGDDHYFQNINEDLTDDNIYGLLN